MGLGNRPLTIVRGRFPRLDSAHLGSPPFRIVTGPTQVQTALAEHWAPIYSKKNCNTVAAGVLLRDYACRKADTISKFSDCRLPNKERFTSIIKKVTELPRASTECPILHTQPVLILLHKDWRAQSTYSEKSPSLGTARKIA